MSFHLQNRPFWGLLVISGAHQIAPERTTPRLFRPRLVARWQREPDGRLERRWHHQLANHQPD